MQLVSEAVGTLLRARSVQVPRARAEIMCPNTDALSHTRESDRAGCSSDREKCLANDPVNNLRGSKPTVERTPGWRARASGNPPASITFARTTTGPVRFIDLLAGTHLGAPYTLTTDQRLSARGNLPETLVVGIETVKETRKPNPHGLHLALHYILSRHHTDVVAHEADKHVEGPTLALGRGPESQAVAR